MKLLQSNCELLSNLSLVSSKFHMSQQSNFTLPRTWVEPDFPVTPTFLYLTRLDLSSSLKGDDHVSQLSASSAFKYLKFLKLKHCGISNDGFRDLIGSPNLRSLEVLILAKNSITKLQFPFDDLKTATRVTLKRDIMEP